MKIFRTLFIAVIAFTVASCGNSTKSDKTTASTDSEKFYQLLDEVMEVHDEMMPQMGKLSELRQNLEEKAEVDPMNAMAYKEAAADLEAAHKSMMDWMKDFGDVFPYKQDRLEGMNEEEIKESIELMKHQQEAVNSMKQEMISSMENAKTMLTK